MELAVKTVFHMRYLVKAVFSGHLSGGLFHCLACRFGACTVEDLVDRRNCAFKIGAYKHAYMDVLGWRPKPLKQFGCK